MPADSIDQRDWVAIFAGLKEAIAARLGCADPLGSEEIRDLADAATDAMYGHKMALCFDKSVEVGKVKPPE